MKMFKHAMMASALVALGACATSGDTTAASADAGVFAGKSVLDAAIDAAGGEAALSQVKELEWTGKATVNADGKTTALNVITVIRPQTNWARSTSWTDAAGQKKARTLQAEMGKAWDVNVVNWTPLPAAQAAHENQQFGLYKLMLLAPLKAAGATTSEGKAGADGVRTIKAQLEGGVPAELGFDATGKLVSASMAVRDPKGGADLQQTIKFSGEIVSNGVKWPKQISIQQNGAPYYDLELATFEANAAIKPRPLQHTLDDGQQPPGDQDAG
ncbi:MAG: hypothetical protein EON93_08620 [Burkholderiales bacterium]|nr:MAG: hypothetical protein EON93_08620 [Burkholderiales bacterium]